MGFEYYLSLRYLLALVKMWLFWRMDVRTTATEQQQKQSGFVQDHELVCEPREHIHSKHLQSEVSFIRSWSYTDAQRSDLKICERFQDERYHRLSIKQLVMLLAWLALRVRVLNTLGAKILPRCGWRIRADGYLRIDARAPLATIPAHMQNRV